MKPPAVVRIMSEGNKVSVLWGAVSAGVTVSVIPFGPCVQGHGQNAKLRSDDFFTSAHTREEGNEVTISDLVLEAYRPHAREDARGCRAVAFVILTHGAGRPGGMAATMRAAGWSGQGSPET